MVRCQWPTDCLGKETFRSLARFIIPKNEVQEQTITVNALGYKISGYPTYLKAVLRIPRTFFLPPSGLTFLVLAKKEWRSNQNQISL